MSFFPRVTCRPPVTSATAAATTAAACATATKIDTNTSEPLSIYHTLPIKTENFKMYQATEPADVYDVLQFRLRTNDRDLQSLLSRSAERLAQVRHARRRG